MKKLKRTGSPNSKNKGAYSEKIQETERKPKTQRNPAHTHGSDGSGSS